LGEELGGQNFVASIRKRALFLLTLLLLALVLAEAGGNLGVEFLWALASDSLDALHGSFLLLNHGLGLEGVRQTLFEPLEFCLQLLQHNYVGFEQAAFCWGRLLIFKICFEGSSCLLGFGFLFRKTLGGQTEAVLSQHLKDRFPACSLKKLSQGLFEHLFLLLQFSRRRVGF
jgi:hypothetical protein